jgi:hypothetical protein
MWSCRFSDGPFDQPRPSAPERVGPCRFVFDLSAAAAPRAAVGDGAARIVAPLVFLALVLASWALRPTSRRLPAHATV